MKNLISRFYEWVVKVFTNPWMPLTALFAFIAVISFFQINSAWADAHKFNGFFGWLGIGILFSVATIYAARKVATTSTGKGG